jgi:hypothetical protein
VATHGLSPVPTLKRREPGVKGIGGWRAETIPVAVAGMNQVRLRRRLIASVIESPD